ncbi:hypothetical protein [Candidatus Parabeggiatoa sp. HSG14]|uniref:hypothetical protein n=1 Tax=Candidatus Parabeggiatoa sp. HSG14 TaxID=3055593 RepID=UPI0025A761D8|nr:hypothetical protein [Thiotrichales bacterium HSG14]
MNNTYSLVKRGTILIPSGSSHHLHFICCNPVYYPNVGKDCVLVVNISSTNPTIEYDQTCILKPEDHPFIKRPSYVYYRKADIYGANNIIRNVAEGTFITHQDCSEPVFEKILKGFSVSEEVKIKILRFYQKYCLNALALTVIPKTIDEHFAIASDEVTPKE